MIKPQERVWIGDVICLNAGGIMKRLVVLALLLASAPASATPQWMNGNKLYEGCTRNTNSTLMYAAGAIDAAADLVDSVGYCIPKAVELGQVSDVLCRYLRNHPEQRHWGGSLLISYAMKEAWPCEKR